MFYRDKPSGGDAAVAVLNSSESKRLIAKGVSRMPSVRRALERGRLVIAGGTTNAFIAEEVLGRGIDHYHYTAGKISGGELGVNETSLRVRQVVMIDGKESEHTPGDVISDFESTDVFIKGANALDTDGVAGVLVSSDSAGTIGTALGILQARGSELIVPIGLEKLVPSVPLAVEKCGQGRFKYSTGERVGLIPIVGASVVTELQAIDVLFGQMGVEAYHVASGGVAGSEGAVVIAIHGDAKGVEEAFETIRGIKGEPSVRDRR